MAKIDDTVLNNIFATCFVSSCYTSVTFSEKSISSLLGLSNRQ